MANVAKIVEIVGCSDTSWDDAAAVAVAEASKTIKGIRGVEVEHMTATVTDGGISQYKTTIKIAFGVES